MVSCGPLPSLPSDVLMFMPPIPLVADKYPSAQVIGLDLSPIQSTWIPPNLRFTVDDFEDEWVCGDDFDLVHMRSTISLVKDVPKLLQAIFE